MKDPNVHYVHSTAQNEDAKVDGNNLTKKLDFSADTEFWGWASPPEAVSPSPGGSSHLRYSHFCRILFSGPEWKWKYLWEEKAELLVSGNVISSWADGSSRTQERLCDTRPQSHAIKVLFKRKLEGNCGQHHPMKEWDTHLLFDAFAEKLMLTGKPVLMLPSMAFPGNKLSEKENKDFREGLKKNYYLRIIS